MTADINKNPITEGVIWKELIKYCIPIAVGTLFQQLYNVVDAIVVGRYLGKEALAAVGGSASILAMIIVAMFSGLTAGASVVIAQYYGANDKRRVEVAIHTAIAFALITGVILGGAGFFGTEWLLEAMRTPFDTMELSRKYLMIYFLGLVATLTYNMGASIQRALGDSRRPLYYIIACSVINIVLDLLFVVILKWGIEGAAWATVIAQLVSCILTLAALRTAYSDVRLSIRRIRINLQMLWDELKIGIPGGLQFSISGITNLMIQTAINGLGTDVTAGWAAYNKVDLIYWMILSSFGAAVTTFVGQNYGANKLKRVHTSTRCGMGITLMLSMVMLAFLMTCAKPLMSIFTTDMNVVNVGIGMMYFMAPLYVVAVFIEIPSGALRGLGKTFWTMVFNMFGMVGLRIPWLMFYVPSHYTVNNVLLSYPIALCTVMVLVDIYYFIEMRKVKTGNVKK